MALVSLREEIDDDCNRYMPIRELDNAALHQVRQIFADYKRRGVIISGSFDDTTWMLTNEAKNIGLTLITFEGGVNKHAINWIGCSYPKYVLYVKAYIVFNLGELCLATIQELSRTFNRLAVSSSDEAADMLEYAVHIVALLQLIPGSNARRDAVINELEEKMERRRWKKETGSQRQLADFKSYLRFNEVLKVFWSGADERQKLFYFPLYFWWNLTAILPLRPTEFLLTPRNCLDSNKTLRNLIVRRTKLKSGKENGNEKIRYRISEDYALMEYTISEQLADELRFYIELTKSKQPSELGTLLVQEPHCAYLGTTPMSSSRYYTYAYLTTCLRYFYKEVVEPSGYDITRVHFGDTRHLAMINLILSGGSPAVCRELAGHASVDISSHYYTNISNLVECVTYERYRKSMGTEAVVHGGIKYSVNLPADSRKVNGGKCSSPVYTNGRIDDCLKVAGHNGHIGDCRHCVYYQPDNPDAIFEFYNARDAKKQVDADSQYLIRMIELVRKGIGYTEDIYSAILHLQRSSDHYGKCLLKKYAREGDRQWQDQEKSVQTI